MVSDEMAPWRRMLGGVTVQSTTEEGTPPGVFPPFKINSMRPESCCATSSAMVVFAPARQVGAGGGKRACVI